MRALIWGFFALFPLAANASDSLGLSLFLNPMFAGGGEGGFAFVVPQGIEILYTPLNNVGLGLGYSALEKPDVFQSIEPATHHIPYFRGGVLSFRGDFFSSDRIMTGWLAEFGIHLSFVDKVMCRNYPYCTQTSIKSYLTSDSSLDAGYGVDFGNGQVRFAIFGLAGYRFQTLKTRHYPVDARIGIGANF